MKNLFSTMLILFVSMLMLSSPAQANSYTETSPPANTESVMFPAATNCLFDPMFEEYFPATSELNGGALKIKSGFIMSCILPVQPNRYIERIALDVSKGVKALRTCKVGYVQAMSGGSASNEMTLTSDNRVYYHDNLGAIDYASGGNALHNVLMIQCQHWGQGADAEVKYGAIRVDYTPASS